MSAGRPKILSAGHTDCARCGRTFRKDRPTSKFCSKTCANRRGGEFARIPKEPRPKDVVLFHDSLDHGKIRFNVYNPGENWANVAHCEVYGGDTIDEALAAYAERYPNWPIRRAVYKVPYGDWVVVASTDGTLVNFTG